MARLTSPSGVSVDVPDEKAARLIEMGFTRATPAAEKAPKRSARKAPAK